MNEEGTVAKGLQFEYDVEEVKSRDFFRGRTIIT